MQSTAVPDSAPVVDDVTTWQAAGQADERKSEVDDVVVSTVRRVSTTRVRTAAAAGWLL